MMAGAETGGGFVVGSVGVHTHRFDDLNRQVLSDQLSHFKGETEF